MRGLICCAVLYCAASLPTSSAQTSPVKTLLQLEQHRGTSSANSTDVLHATQACLRTHDLRVAAITTVSLGASSDPLDEQAVLKAFNTWTTAIGYSAAPVSASR